MNLTMFFLPSACCVLCSLVVLCSPEYDSCHHRSCTRHVIRHKKVDILIHSSHDTAVGRGVHICIPTLMCGWCRVLFRWETRCTFKSAYDL